MLNKTAISAETLEDMPKLARLLASSDLQKTYADAVRLLQEIDFDAIMREISDIVLQPAGSGDSAILKRAFSDEQRVGFHKARRAITQFLDLRKLENSVPRPPDYGASDILKSFGYDPEKITDSTQQ